jgi:putative phosphoesterase
MGLENLDGKEVVRLGVLSDTHIPDRKRELHPRINELFSEKKVDLIIHAGDLSTLQVISELEKTAPVYAVKGNRDWFMLKNLPSKEILFINGLKILVAHGQGSLLRYLLDKIPNLLFGYNFDRFLRNFSDIGDDIDIVIYGHSHRSEVRWINGRLFFNPGSASDSGIDEAGPSIGLLEISSSGEIDAKIIKLE